MLHSFQETSKNHKIEAVLTAQMQIKLVILALQFRSGELDFLETGVTENKWEECLLQYKK